MKLLKVVISFLALVSLQIAAAQWLHVPPPVEAKMTAVMVGGGVPVAAASCTDITGPGGSSADYGDYAEDSSGFNIAQKVKYAGSSCSIGSVVVELAKASADVAIKLQVWTTADKSTGSQVGGDSDTQTVTSGSFGAYSTFTWATNKPTPSDDYYIHIVKTVDSTRILVPRRASATYEDTNYDYWAGANTASADVNFDWSFSVNYD